MVRPRRPRVRLVAVAAGVLALLLGACGSAEDDATVASSDDTDAASDGSGDVVEGDEDAGDAEDAGDGSDGSDGSDVAEEVEEAAPAATAAQGTVVVAGTSYEITELRNCEPLDMGAGIERLLELQGSGEVDGERVQVDVYVSDGPAGPLHEVSWDGPEGVRGNQVMEAGGQWTDNTQTPLGEPPLELTADRVTGTMPVLDAMTQDDPVDLSLDLAVPAELIACR